MFFVHLRCVKCHSETGAAPISLEKWPTIRIDFALTCRHRFFEVRLTETQATNLEGDNGLVQEPKGS